MSHPKITVIIPTRERCDVLVSALRTVTAQDYDNLEILVCDNCSADATHEVVVEARDPRIRYVNTHKRVSMSHNWEFALSYVSDGWVTFMGDDDGLLPNGVRRIAEVIDDTQSHAIRTEYCTYDWPGVPDHPRGQLIVPMTNGVHIRNSFKWLHDALNGRTSYKQLPMIYNGGFIHYAILNKIREKMGSFFSSVNPDVYSAVAVAKVTESYLFVTEPIAISGTSIHSNGYSAFSTNTQRNREAYSQFLAEGNIPFHTDMPTLEDGTIPLSLQACLYEAYLQCPQLTAKRVDGDIYARQLAIILATSGRHRDVIDRWGEQFALLHRLDYASAMRTAARLRPKLRARAAIEKVLRALHSVIASRLDLHNVYEASVAAAVIRAAPSRRDTLRFFVHTLIDTIRRTAHTEARRSE